MGTHAFPLPVAQKQETFSLRTQNQRLSFAIYPSINAPKHFCSGASSSLVSPRGPCFLFSRRKRRGIRCTNACQKLLMVAESEDTHISRALESDIKEYLDSLPEEVSNPLSYVNLGKEGRIDLVPRIIDAGGYIEVSKRLGIPVDEAQFLPPPTVSESGLFKPFLEPQDPGASIAIGKSLEDRMKSIDEPGKQSSFPRSVPSSPKLRTIDAVPSAAELVELNEQILPPVVDEVSVHGENLSLTGPMRVGLLILTTIAALGFGKASHGTLNPSIIQVSQSAACGLTLAHSLLALYSAFLVAPRMRRSSSVWFIKVLLGGPLAVVELRSLGSADVSTR